MIVNVKLENKREKCVCFVYAMCVNIVCTQFKFVNCFKQIILITLYLIYERIFVYTLINFLFYICLVYEYQTIYRNLTFLMISIN